MELHSKIRRYVVFFGTILLIVQNAASTNHRTFCRSHYCLRTAVSILLNANFSVHPCENFYEHACGMFIRQRNIPKNALTLGYPQIVTRNVQVLLKDLLELPKTQDDSALVEKAKDLYAACMDTETIEKEGFDIFEFYLRMDDGWIMTMENLDSPVDWKPWIRAHNYLARLTGTGSVIDLRVYAHNATHNMPMIHIDRPRYLYGIYNPVMTETQKGYYKEFVRDLVLIFAEARGSDVQPSDLDTDVDDLMEFRERLARIMMPSDEKRNLRNEYNIFTLEEVQAWYDNGPNISEHARIDWVQFLTDFTASSIHFDPADEVVLSDPEYIRNLLHVLRKTTRRTISNHINLYFVENHLSYAPSAVREIARVLHENMTGVRGLSERERWKFCLTEHPMQHVLGKMLADVKVSARAKQIVKLIAKCIKETLVYKISRSAWIDEPTKQRALLKLENMKIYSAYSDWYDNATAMEQYYALQTAGVNALPNALSYSRNEHSRMMETLKSNNPPNRIAHHYYATDRIVFYAFEENALYINAAMLQWPYFTEMLPENVNFAALGSLIGKEIIHVIDIIGIHFDENGFANDWWGASLGEYQERLACIVSKYTGYNETNLTPYANNIADVLSLQLVTDSYLEYSTTTPRKMMPHLPGLREFDDVDMFFLVSASVQCEKIDPTYNETLVTTDLYNLPDFRVNVPRTMSWEFSEAYGCYDFSTMNPQDKCKVWGA